MLEMSAQNSLLCFEVSGVGGAELEEESETEGKTVHNGLCGCWVASEKKMNLVKLL